MICDIPEIARLIYAFLGTLCSLDTFRCKNGTCLHDGRSSCSTISPCIPFGWLCDGEKDCTDGSDESKCEGKGAIYYQT